jgi:hypothetical protein
VTRACAAAQAGLGQALLSDLSALHRRISGQEQERDSAHAQTAARMGNHGGRPKVIDDDMLTFTIALKDKGTPVPEIAKKLIIQTGKNAGKHPSVASLYRALADAEEAVALAAADDGLPLRPKAARILWPDGPLTPEEIDLRERLVAQRAQFTAADRLEQPGVHRDPGPQPMRVAVMPPSTAIVAPCTYAA